MNSFATDRFRKAFDALPVSVQTQAKRAYDLWKRDPYHESLQFKHVHEKRPIYSVRIGLHWRALGVKEDDSVTWFWIGSHANYDELISNL